jgi:hypothetical protein
MLVLIQVYLVILMRLSNFFIGKVYMEEDYYRKYLKYKRKYLRLKYGGAKPKIGEARVAKPAPGPIPKEEYQPEKYQKVLDELKDTIIEFMKELDCCKFEINIPYGEDIPNPRRKFIQLLKDKYDEMVAIIRKKTGAVIDISRIGNNVPPEELESLLKDKYEPIATTVFEEYQLFLSKLLKQSQVEKVPVYSLVPIARDKNPDMPTKQFEQIGSEGEVGVDNGYTRACAGDTPIQKCYLGLSLKLGKIKGAIAKLVSENLKSSTAEESAKKIYKGVEFQFNIIQQIQKEMAEYDKSLYSKSSNKKIYGDVRIYDERMCPVHSKKECKPPCKYYDKTKNCILKY